MQIGDLVVCDFTKLYAVVVDIKNIRCRVVFMDGRTRWSNTYHLGAACK